ncbi:MAG: TetR/AcrR family transcriptional regulator [Solirubrobacterales bacterium]
MSPRPAIDHVRKPQILDAAAAVITERGLSNTRIADVAERAGTSPPAVLYWFETREQLLTAALIADEEAFAERIGERLDDAVTATEKLALLIEATVAEPRIDLWIELWARSLHDPDAARERLRRDRVWRSLFAEVVLAGRAAGEFDLAVDPDLAALSITSFMDGLSVQMTLRDPALTPELMESLLVGHAEGIVGASLRPGLDAEAVGA